MRIGLATLIGLQAFVARAIKSSASRFALAAAAIALSVSACGGGGSDQPSMSVDTLESVKIVQGNEQTGEVGKELASPLRVQVIGSSGSAIAGQVVTFRVASGGGSVAVGSVPSDDSGYATERWTLGTTAGIQILEVSGTDSGGVDVVLATFTATAKAGRPKSVIAVSGNDQAAQQLHSLTSPLIVRVLDVYGNPVPEVLVSFTSPDGGVASPSTTSTNSAGEASTNWTLGPAVGTQSLNAIVNADVGLTLTGSALQASPSVLSLFAGALGGPGHTDGVGAGATFNFPASVATDRADNVYVADYHTIRKITPDGVVTTLAGWTEDRTYGIGAYLRLDSPRGVATDRDGIVYVADTFTGLVSKITPAGLATPFARSANPSGVDTDAEGNVYINECGSGWEQDPETRIYYQVSNKIRKLTSAGVEIGSMLGPCAGLPTPFAEARTRFPSSIAIGRAGTLYIADENHTVSGMERSVGLPGVSGSADGTGTSARFNYPSGIAADSAENVYVADTDNNKIRKITRAGVVTTLAGADYAGAADGVGAEARFNAPLDVAVDSVVSFRQICMK